jgi:hypothetical protein
LHSQNICSKYDNNCVQLFLNDAEYRIDVKDLKGILCELFFRSEKKNGFTFLKPVLDGLEDGIYTDQFYIDHDDFFNQNEDGKIK